MHLGRYCQDITVRRLSGCYDQCLYHGPSVDPQTYYFKNSFFTPKEPVVNPTLEELYIHMN